MLDTSKTAGKTAESTQQETSGPGFDWLLIAAAAIAVAILGAIAWNVAQNDEPSVDTAAMVSGFEYNTDATSGRSAAPGVTSQYFGHSDELYPEEEATPETPVQWTPPEYRADYGDADATSATEPVTDFEDTTDATTGKSAADGVTTPYFGLNPEFD